MSSDTTLPPLPSPDTKQLGPSSYNKNITLYFNVDLVLQGCLDQVKLDLTEIETGSRRCQVPDDTEPPVSLSRGP